MTEGQPSFLGKPQGVRRPVPLLKRALDERVLATLDLRVEESSLGLRWWDYNGIGQRDLGRIGCEVVEVKKARYG